jgi:translation initiation factor 2 subunit 3
MIKTLKLSEIIQNQAVLNAGCIGHVSNGKSTLVRQMTGIKTQKFKSEKERNCTINVGYGNCKIFYNEESDEYKFTGSDKLEEIDSKGSKMNLIHHISFVDCPGHENYMSNMLCGASVIDMAFLVEAANAKIVPQPQTLEHFIAIQHTDVEDIVIIQNKCDLVKKESILTNKSQIEDFVDDITDNELPIIPLIAQNGDNIEYVGQYLSNKLVNYDKDINLPLQINIIRTFDVNKPNITMDKLTGGVLGGSIIQGLLKKDQIIQISPGICSRNKDNSWKVEPLFTKVNSINSEKNSMSYAIPGGLIGVGTTLDPAYTKGNKLTGQIITSPGKHLPIVSSITIKYSSFRRVSKISKSLSKNELVKLGIISNHVSATVIDWDKKKKLIKLQLAIPACINDSVVSIMKKIDKTYKIFSVGKVVEHDNIKVEVPAEYIVEDKYKYEIINDVSKTKEIVCLDYDSMLDKLSNKLVKKVKLKLPNPIITKTKNGRQQIVNNFGDIVKTLENEKDEQSFTTIFEKEIASQLSCSVNQNDKKSLLIHGKVKNTAISNSIMKALCKIRKCSTCNGFNTFLNKTGRSLMMSCIECKSESIITI